MKMVDIIIVDLLPIPLLHNMDWATDNNVEWPTIWHQTHVIVEHTTGMK